jgi:shikimate dehydrogenase
MKKFGVIGFPLSHSLSPQMHNAAFRELAIEAVYEKYEIPAENFEVTMPLLKHAGYSGFNVTIPHKSRILTYMDEIDADAAAIGAMNTVVIRQERWIGFNTDIAGFISPLLEMNKTIGSVLVLGTGGAARAVIFALIKYIKPKKLTVAGRNTDKTGKICDHFYAAAGETVLVPAALNEVRDQTDRYHLIVNATPLGMYPDSEQTPLPGLKSLREKAIVYDLVYNPVKTRLLRDAEKSGNDVFILNGLEMLLQQAALSFRLWTKKEMPLATVRKSLLETLNDRNEK